MQNREQSSSPFRRSIASNSSSSPTASPPSAPPLVPPRPSGSEPSKPQSSPGRALRLPGSAFSASFLEKLRLVARTAAEAGEVTATEAEALVSGALAVEEVTTATGGARYAVVRRDEPVAEGGKAAAVFRSRSDALLAAAVLPAVAPPSPYRLKDKPKRLG